jgi:hypothetical protein
MSLREKNATPYPSKTLASFSVIRPGSKPIDLKGFFLRIFT